MDVEVALPSGNIGDEPEACGNTLEGYTCAAPEYTTGKTGGRCKEGGADVWPVVFVSS
jgi:hypothetical protein